VRPLALAMAVLLLTATAQAQEAPTAPEDFRLPEPSEVLPLRRGATAPRDGLLIDAGELLRISQEYDRMRYLLTRTEERDREVCDVRVAMEQARTTACSERLTLRDELWAARQAELLAQVAEAREATARANERGWWESPILWVVIGAVAVAAVWIAVEVE
jgi:hypothetical protein